MAATRQHHWCMYLDAYRSRRCPVRVPDKWIAYLDCWFMFVQMSAMSVACTFSSNPALAPLGSRSLLIFSRWRLTVSIVWRSACTAMASIHQACGRMAAPGRTTSGAPVSARMRAASAALLRRIIIRRYAQQPRPGGQAKRTSQSPRPWFKGGQKICAIHISSSIRTS